MGRRLAGRREEAEDDGEGGGSSTSDVINTRIDNDVKSILLRVVLRNIRRSEFLRHSDGFLRYIRRFGRF